ncbi:MOSC domain-containing protein [Clostridium sp.]|uniref:MOSC domain-containing protein n=1 Tax=Clostridium sp. TaxID=1506 RepID=UPI003463A85D
MGKVLAVCTSDKKGIGKTDVKECVFVENHGLKGDAHAGDWHRQVSLLAMERITEFREKGGKVELGDFGENLVTEGVDLVNLPIGTKLSIGETLLEVTQIGKQCHKPCNIFYTVGSCIMPTNGIFAKVLKGGKVKVGDEIQEVK